MVLKHFPVGSGAKLVLDHMRHQTRILARMDDYSGVARWRPRPWSGAKSAEERALHIGGRELLQRHRSRSQPSEVQSEVVGGAAQCLLAYGQNLSEQVEETVRLKLHQTLQEQGLADAKTAILCCTYVPGPRDPGCMVLREMRFETSEEELSLVEGVTHLTTPSNLCRLHLSKSLIGLKSLTFGVCFNQSLERASPCLTVCKI